MGKTWARGKTLQLFVTSTCLTAFVLFGYDQGVFSGILQNEDWLTRFNHPDDTLTGIIVSSYNLGCLVGCVINFWLGEKLGRRRSIWFAMVWVTIGAILQASAFTLPHLIVGRIITGLGTGIETSTVPMYQAELSEPEKRGRLISAEVLFVGVGITIAYWYDFGMSFAGGQIAWRLPLATQIVFAIFVVIIVFGVPESPRWLLKHGQRQAAVESLCAVYDLPEDDEKIREEIAMVEENIEIEAKLEEREKFWSVFKKDEIGTRNRIGLAWAAQFMNQMGGINLIIYYAPTLLVSSVGLDSQLAQIIGGCINMMFMFGSIPPTFFLDQMGRRKTMMWGSLGLAICMLMVSALLSQSTRPDVGKNYGSASIAFFFIYMLIFGSSVNCVPWVYVPEILPLKARTRGTAIGVSSNWMWNFFVVMISPVILKRLAWKAYLVFMSTNFAFIPLVYFFFPETGNVSLEDVDHFFTGGKNPVTVARKVEKDRKERIRAGEVPRRASRVGASFDESDSKEAQVGVAHQEKV